MASITPEENTNTVMKNEFEYKAELLSALINSMQDEEVSISASMVKDTEAYRKGILNALNVEYTDDDVKHTSVFRSKVIEGVKAMSGGGGDPETVQITIRNQSSHPIIFSTMIDVNGLRASYRIANNNTERGIRVVMFVPEMPFTFTTEDGGSISSTSTFGTVTFNSAYSGVITQGDTITIASA